MTGKGMNFDVTVIGAGIAGTLTLDRYDNKALMQKLKTLTIGAL